MNSKANANGTNVQLLNSNLQATFSRIKSQTKKSVKDDRYQEQLLRRTWLALIKDYYPVPIYDQLAWYFNSHNDVSEIIEAAVQVADYALGTGPRPSSPFMYCYRMTDLEDAGSVRRLLTVCRFGKRYTPSSMENEGPTAFWETNDRLARIDWEQHSTMVGWLRAIVHQLLDSYRVDWSEWSLTSGSTYDGDQTIVDKLLSVEKVYPALLGISLGTPEWNVHNGVREPYHYNKIKAVPKNYKKMRHIAVEPQWIGVMARPVGLAIERCLPTYADIHDQSHNINLAKAGSRDNSLATIDLSAASDSVARRLCELVLPARVYQDIRSVTSHSEPPRRDRWGNPSEYYDAVWGWVDATREYHMISTMGNRVTFPLETLIFSAILELTAYLNDDYCSSSKCGVYGDDIICPSTWVPTLLDLLTTFGFIPNGEKSFYGSEYFRESCGGEFLHGETVQSSYWPRVAINRDNAFSHLIALQHKFWLFPNTNAVLCREIRTLYPKVTESFPGSIYDDIWSDFPDIVRAWGAYNGKSPESEPSCEIHTMVYPEKGNTVWNESLDRYNYYCFLKNGHRDHEDPVLAGVGYPADKDRSWGLVHPRVRVRNQKFLL